MYGGMNPGAYRLFLTQGELDPVRTLGPSNDINPLSPVVVIPRKKIIYRLKSLHFCLKQFSHSAEMCLHRVNLKIMQLFIKQS